MTTFILKTEDVPGGFAPATRASPITIVLYYPISRHDLNFPYQPGISRIFFSEGKTLVAPNKESPF